MLGLLASVLRTFHPHHPLSPAGFRITPDPWKREVVWSVAGLIGTV